MKKLLWKEMTLTASPLSYLFLLFTAMVFIPNYPLLVCAFFVCFGIFQTFQKARESNDTLYTAMLPVKKSTVVRAKFLFAVFIQGLALVLIIGWALLRICCLNPLAGYQGSQLMNANLVFLGFVLVIFALFNICFIGGFFKTAYKIGIPFLIFAIVTFVTVGVGEALHFIPGLGFLNDDYHPLHWIFLAVGVVVYALGTFLALRKAEQRFHKIDL